MRDHKFASTSQRKKHFVLRTPNLYLDTLIICYKRDNMLGTLDKIILQKECRHACKYKQKTEDS